MLLSEILTSSNKLEIQTQVQNFLNNYITSSNLTYNWNFIWEVLIWPKLHVWMNATINLKEEDAFNFILESFLHIAYTLFLTIKMCLDGLGNQDFAKNLVELAALPIDTGQKILSRTYTYNTLTLLKENIELIKTTVDSLIDGKVVKEISAICVKLYDGD